MRLSRAARVVLLVALAAIVAATIRPDFSRDARSWTNCILCGGRGLSDAVVNLILFVPLGVGLALARAPLVWAAAAGALLSMLVELSQMVLPGRDPSLGDLLFNTAGSAAGYVLVAVTLALGRLGDRASARWSVVASLVVVLDVTAAGWLLQPSFFLGDYWGMWTPPLGHLEPYRGRVISATLDGVPVPYQRIHSSAWARLALLAGRPIEVDAVAGPPVRATACLFCIYDDQRLEIVLIGPYRDDLVYRYRTRATALRLDQPDVRLVGGMRGIRAGDPLRVRAWSPAPGSYCLATPTANACDLGFTVGDGWGLLLYPESFPYWLRRILSLGWVTGLVLPVGFLLRRRWESAAALVAALAAFGVLPAALALRPTEITEWLGVCAGLTAGIVSANAFRRTAPLGPPAPAVPLSARHVS